MKRIEDKELLNALIETINIGHLDPSGEKILKEFLSQLVAVTCYDRPLRASVIKMQRLFKHNQRAYKKYLDTESISDAADKAFERQIDKPYYTY